MKGYLNATRLVTKLKMLRSGKKSKSFLIVEGITDLRFYSKFIASSACEVLIADSKENVKTCITSCNQEGIPGIIGIVDADFLRLEEEELKIENLYLTDEHDLECMLVHSPAYENIIIEYAEPNKYARFQGRKQQNVRDLLLRNASYIGFLRRYSLEHNLGLRFHGLDFTTFVSKNGLEVDKGTLVRQVLLLSKRLNTYDADELIAQLDLVDELKEERWQLCCGHDLVELLTLGLINIFGDYNAKTLFSGQLEGSFRLAYTSRYFESTALYAALVEWENSHKPYQILAPQISSHLQEASV